MGLTGKHEIHTSQASAFASTLALPPHKAQVNSVNEKPVVLLDFMLHQAREVEEVTQITPNSHRKSAVLMV